jgi:hypothetical protein
MKRIWIMAAAGCFIAFGTAAQNSSGTQAGASASAGASGSASVGRTGAQAESSTSAMSSARAGQDAFQLQNGQTIHANLDHSVDAKKCKPGDRVEARTTQDVKENGQVVLKKGSRLHGHVTEAQARSKGSSQSSLGIVFDSFTAKNGEEMPLHLGIQAIAAPVVATAASMEDDQAMAGGGAMAGGSAAGGRRVGGGLVGGAAGAVGGVAGATSVAGGSAGNLAGNAGGAVNGTVGATTRAAGSATVSTAGGLNAAGQLTPGSRGVFGLEGLTLTSAASSATQASVISSSSRNVHLDSGTQMELQAVGQQQ